MHQCRGCVRNIAGSHHYCLFCRSRLRKEGSCEYCGKLAAAKAHIVKCRTDLAARAQAAAIPRADNIAQKYRDGGARENRRETKYGCD